MKRLPVLAFRVIARCSQRFVCDGRRLKNKAPGEKMPAPTGMVVQGLWHPDCLIEVEGIAVL
jgi:hypothetical protein